LIVLGLNNHKLKYGNQLYGQISLTIDRYRDNVYRAVNNAMVRLLPPALKLEKEAVGAFYAEEAITGN
jgi:hypothetical protein